MKTDTTLFDIYSDLNVISIMQNEEAVDYIDEVVGSNTEEIAA